MKKTDISLSWGVALLLILAGTMGLWYSTTTARTTEKRLLRKQETLNTLNALHRQALADQAAIRHYQSIPEPVRQPIEELRSLLEQQSTSQWTSLGSEPVVDDWIRESLRISVPALKYNRLTPFLDQAAALQPPWILQSIELNPAPDAGTGAATLVLTSIFSSKT